MRYAEKETSMENHLYAVIMAGGIGSRLWPRSRSSSPKQFLDLVGEQTMLQETVDRIEPLVPLQRVLVVVGKDQAETVCDQLPGLPADNVIIEPGPRGTAPCIGLSAVALLERDPASVMAVFPADHCIADAAGFRQAIAAAAQVARDGYLVTLGIAPTQPHTGYGYIQRGEQLENADDLPAYRVKRFTEKPDASTARQFVSSGEYYWNAGIFVWQASTILTEMERLLPQLYAELQAIARLWGSEQLAARLETAWQQVPKTTIDYGVMEKATRVAVVPVDIGWDDVGNWATLSKLLESDHASNVLRGEGRHVVVDTHETYVYASAGRLVAVVGLEKFVVVDTPDALLVCPKDRAQDVRDVVNRLEEDGLQDYL
jgi:mannose-1-phosphate guanylyltransferase